MIDGLRQWLRCMAGSHEWVQLDDEHGDSLVFCLQCGERQ